MVSAFDIYTGRRLWEWRPGPEDKEPWFYTAREVHWIFEPLAGRVVATGDVVSVVSDKRCMHSMPQPAAPLMDSSSTNATTGVACA